MIIDAMPKDYVAGNPFPWEAQILRIARIAIPVRRLPPHPATTSYEHIGSYISGQELQRGEGCYTAARLAHSCEYCDRLHLNKKIALWINRSSSHNHHPRNVCFPGALCPLSPWVLRCVGPLLSANNCAGNAGRLRPCHASRHSSSRPA